MIKKISTLFSSKSPKVSEPPEPHGIFVRDILFQKSHRGRELHFVHPKDPVSRAIKLLLSHDISQLPVLIDSHPVGSVTEKGIAGKLSSFEVSRKGDAGTFGELQILEVMELPLPSVKLNQDQKPPFAELRNSPAVMVMDGNSCIGIITLADIAEYRLKP
jgi:predicted transcriptional regulator